MNTRVAVVAVAAVLLSACLVRGGGGGQPEPGPEQFVFTMIPGSGSGPDAVAALEEAIGENVSEADHVAFVDTPMGRFDVYRYEGTMGNNARPMVCEAFVGVMSSGATCSDNAGAAGAEDPFGAPEGEVRVGGVGTDQEWSTIEVRGGKGVASLAATTADGVVYRANFVSGVSMLMVPTRRGSLTVQGLDADGAPIGQSVPAALDLGAGVVPER